MCILGDRLVEVTRVKSGNIILGPALIICLVMVAGFTSSVSPVVGEAVAALPEIANFQVSPASIGSGTSATLSWDVKNASAINIDHGIGSVSLSGQVKVNPPYSTTYKLSVSNETGVRARYVTLYVEIARLNITDEVNYDPVTGRNSQVDLSWESYCLSDQYQVQIARDAGFTLIMYDSGSMGTADSMRPAFWYPPGNLEAGHTYYWRVRTTRAATGQHILSYWSEIRPLTVKPGYAVRTDYMTVQAFIPANGCAACPVKPVSFSWSGYPNTTKYRFILAKDSQLQDIVVEGLTPTTSYALPGPLEYGTSYFWQVMALEPIPSDASSVFTFHTEPAPVQTAKQATSSLSREPPPWAMAVMAVGTALIIAVIILAVVSRKRI
jgi:hypothetical protein